MLIILGRVKMGTILNFLCPLYMGNILELIFSLMASELYTLLRAWYFT